MGDEGRVLADVFTALYPPGVSDAGPARIVEYTELPRLVRNMVAERDRLSAVVDAVRVMWDNIVGTEDDAVMGFPISDYNAIENALDALDALDVSGATDG